jgi:hypothetical protein
MQSETPETKQRPHSYSWLYPSVAMLIAVLIGWSIFWYFKTRQIAAAFDTWAAHQAQLGRTYSCPDRKIGGFPFSVEITCTNPFFQGDVLGKKVSGSMRSFRASAPLLRTENVVAQLDAPLAAKSSDGTLDITAQWGQAILDFQVENGTLERVSLSGDQVRVQGRIGGADAGKTAFDEFNSYFVISPDRHDRAYDIMVSFNQGAVPAINSFLGSELPLAMVVEGTISQVDLSSAATLQDFLDKWRAAKGHLDIKTAWLTSGSIIFDAKGGLDLDDQHRPKGKLDASFGGFEKAFRSLDIDPALLNAGHALSALLNGSRSSGTGRLELPVTFSEGVVSIGQLRTPIELAPLY